MYLAVKPTGAINSFNLFVDAKREKGKENQIVFDDTYTQCPAIGSSDDDWGSQSLKSRSGTQLSGENEAETMHQLLQSTYKAPHDIARPSP
ncbi:hypothetical protein OUZ56_001491 [Daphnia magna]|uniref:Uncharacterized protein n=1 Tax=Daphnia magna TaxID=35525 RepID=A0ABR0A2T5_9CRUS|nr:hypothetical protein OUZ56_001491 [Daphnia magna]